MKRKTPAQLVTPIVRWLTVSLFAAALAACGSNESGLYTTAADVSSIAKDAASNKTAIHVPKFSEIRFTPSALDSTINKIPLLKSVNPSTGLVGGYLRPDWIWNSHRINVCWENPSGWDDTQRRWVKEAVTSTWDANSDVTFVDWSTCPEYDKSHVDKYIGARLFITTGQPRTRRLGEAGIDYNQNVQLNLDFASWSEESNCAFSSVLESCVKTAAIHEFGHVLAFAHEQYRADTPQACVDQGAPDKDNDPGRGEGDPAYVAFGAWDLNSVMNYCNPVWGGNGNLSSIDIEMLQKYYGKPGSKVYSVFTANDPPIVSIQDSKTFEDVADYITIPNAQGSVLRHFYSTPDGNKVAYTLFNQQKGSSVLGYIDTQTDTLRGQKAIAEEVVDMKVSSDSKYAYVVWKNGATGGLRAYDLNAFTVAWDLPLTGASQIVAQRVASSQRIYVVKSSGTGSAQSIVAVDASSHTQVASYAVGTTRARPLVVGLTPDEETLYLADPGPDNQSAPFIASLDTTSGQYTVLQPISPADASIHDLHVLDSKQVLLGTNKQGISPLIYTVSTKSFSALTGGVPSDWSLPYVYSPDGKTVFSMGQYWDGKIPYYSFIRLDSYRLNEATGPVVWDGSNHPVISAGFGQDVVTRPFAVIYR